MKVFIIIACILYAGFTSSAQHSRGETGNDTRIKLGLLNEYHRLKPPGRVWYDTGLQSAALRNGLHELIEECSFEGLTYEDMALPNPAFIYAAPETQILSDKKEDIYAMTALYLAWNYLRGQGTEETLSYDGVSRICQLHDQIKVAAGLAAVQTHDQLLEWLSTLLPKTKEYRLLQDSLTACIQEKRTPWTVRLIRALNDYRWIHHFGFERLIVINIPAAELRYYVDDTLQLSMKVIVGQPSKRTPRFAAWCSSLILYPYWNIPAKIARQEFFPLLQTTPFMANNLGLQFVDKNERIVDPASIRWNEYNALSFPYRIRQIPGCGNALGVLKFELTDPFNVYMHDTNLKNIFSSDYRYFSHGCIRLERPIDLGLALMDGHLDTATLLACFKDRQPALLPLPARVPVFVIYNTVGVLADGRLQWYKDIYHLRQ